MMKMQHEALVKFLFSFLEEIKINHKDNHDEPNA